MHHKSYSHHGVTNYYLMVPVQSNLFINWKWSKADISMSFGLRIMFSVIVSVIKHTGNYICSYSVTSLAECRASQHVPFKIHNVHICQNKKTAPLIYMFVSWFIRILCSLATSVFPILRLGICEYLEGKQFWQSLSKPIGDTAVWQVLSRQFRITASVLRM